MYEWIENLKVGDLVFVSCRLGKSLKKVEKITPKGYIKNFQEKLIINKALRIMREKRVITLEQAYKIIELLDHPTEKGGVE